MRIPDEVRHVFAFAFDLTEAALDNRKVYRCKFCKVWTDTMTNDTDLAFQTVCRARDRRTKQRRIAAGGGRRQEDFKPHLLALRQSQALNDENENQRQKTRAMAGMEDGISCNPPNDSGNRTETPIRTAVLSTL